MALHIEFVFLFILQALLFYCLTFIFKIFKADKTNRYIVRYKIDNHPALAKQYFVAHYTFTWKQGLQGYDMFDGILNDIIIRVEKSYGIKITYKDVAVCFLSMVN